MMYKTFTTRLATPGQRSGSRRSAAFSLMEVLVAMGIFTVGLVAVAAIFPTAITIQRETVREVDGRRIGKNARAMVLAAVRTDATRPGRDNNPAFEMSYTGLPAPGGSLEPFFTAAFGVSAANPTPVLPMVDLPELTIPSQAGVQRSAAGLDLDAPASFHGLFPLDVRSYPQNTNFNPAGTVRGDQRRDYYWYPLLQVSNVTSPQPVFSMFLMIMHRSGSDLPPEVRRSNDITNITGSEFTFGNNFLGTTSNDADGNGLPDLVQAGDLILADDGKVHRVILATANTVTVNSDDVGNPTRIYFGVNLERGTRTIKREAASPVVWIEDSIDLTVNP